MPLISFAMCACDMSTNWSAVFELANGLNVWFEHISSTMEKPIFSSPFFAHCWNQWQNAMNTPFVQCLYRKTAFQAAILCENKRIFRLFAVRLICWRSSFTRKAVMLYRLWRTKRIQLILSVCFFFRLFILFFFYFALVCSLALVAILCAAICNKRWRFYIQTVHFYYC